MSKFERRGYLLACLAAHRLREVGVRALPDTERSHGAGEWGVAVYHREKGRIFVPSSCVSCDSNIVADKNKHAASWLVMAALRRIDALQKAS